METTIFQYAIRVSSSLFILRASFDGVEEIIRVIKLIAGLLIPNAATPSAVPSFAQS